ncbi:MAG: hypothetical protein LWY06_01675 [Firmicutes bacterium]|nr:hypothetical protein [Bacillota bacterium]
MSDMRKRNSESGFAIVVVIVILVIIVVVALILNSMGIQHLGFVRKQKHDTKALYAAESGVARAISSLKKNRTWDGTVDGSGNESKLTFLNSRMPNSDDTYTVKVYNNFSGASEIKGYNGIVVPPGACLVISKGKSGLISSKDVGVMITRSSFFDFGIFGDKSVDISGNVSVTAKDSATGMSVPGGADVGTNGVTKGSVTMNGTPVYVDGSIYAGYGANLATDQPILLHGHCSLTGEQKTLNGTKTLGQVVLPTNLVKRTFSQGMLMPGDYSGETTLTIVNQDVTLTGSAGGAKYIFSGITASGKGKLIIDASSGPVVIYLNGNVSFSGQSGITITHSGSLAAKPGDLIFLGTGNCKDIKLTGISSFIGGIYAPSAQLSITGDTQMYGGSVSGAISMKGSIKYDYDTALKKQAGLDNLSVGSWQYF